MNSKFNVGTKYAYSSDDGDTLKLVEIASTSFKNYSSLVMIQHESYRVSSPNPEYAYFNFVDNGFVAETGAPVFYNGVAATPSDSDFTSMLPDGWTDADGTPVKVRVSKYMEYYDENWNKIGHPIYLSGEKYYPTFPSIMDPITHRVTGSFADFSGRVAKYGREYVSYDFIFKNDDDEITSIPTYDVNGNALAPKYADDGWHITNEVYDAVGSDKKRVTKRVPFMPNCPALAVNSSFKLDESWKDGEIKNVSFYGMLEPIKLNAQGRFQINGDSFTSADKRKGPVAFTIVFDNGITGYIFLHSFFSVFASSNESDISNRVRAYNVELKLIRKGRKIEILDAEYEIPYYILDEGEYAQGILKYRNTASNGTTSMPDRDSTVLFTLDNSGQGPFSSASSSEKAVSMSITINSDWMPFGDGGYCGSGSTYSNSFMLDLNDPNENGNPVASTMNLSIESIGPQVLAIENLN